MKKKTQMSDERYRMEVEANQIAFEILMPTATVKRLIANNESIERMAEYFYVPETVMYERAKQFGYTLLESI